MYRRCPACQHELAASATPGPTCPACGLVYDKWMRRQLAAAGRDTAAQPSSRDGATPVDSAAAWLAARAFHCEEHVNPFVFGGRAVVWLGLAWLTGWFVAQDHTLVEYGANPIGEHFLHVVNLVFHEAGHVVFRLFGDFMAVLGGSLLQVLMPAIVAGTFLLRHANPFGAAVGLWWTGQSLVDVAVYIADAAEGRLLLLGGVTGNDAPGYHDWTNLLSRTGLLAQDDVIAGIAFWGGAALMATACAWGAALLWQQYARLDRRF